MQLHFSIHSFEMFYKKEIWCKNMCMEIRMLIGGRKNFAPLCIHTCTLYIHKGHNVVDRHTVN